jgi:hypothetical protein
VLPATTTTLSATRIGSPALYCRRAVIPVGAVCTTLLFHAVQIPINTSFGSVVITDGATPADVVPVWPNATSIGAVVLTPPYATTIPVNPPLALDVHR